MRLFDNPDYVATLRRYSVLLHMARTLVLSPEEVEELQAANEVLSGIEAKHFREHSLRGLTDDYDEAMRNANHLGVVEL